MEIQASRAAARGRPGGRADPAARSEPRALGPAADPPRPGRARARRDARRRARALRAAGGDRRLPRARAHRRRHRLGAHRRALRSSWPSVTPSPVVELNRAVAVAMAFGPAAGLAHRRRAGGRAGAGGLSPAAQRARRSALPPRPLRRGARRVRARRRAHAQRARARLAARARGRRRGSAGRRSLTWSAGGLGGALAVGLVQHHRGRGGGVQRAGRPAAMGIRTTLSQAARQATLRPLFSLPTRIKSGPAEVVLAGVRSPFSSVPTICTA